MVHDDLPRFGIPKRSDDLDEALDLHDLIVHASTLAALEAGDVMPDHYGVGLQLAPCVERQFGAEGMGLLRRIKSVIDPSHLLCPGKLGTQS
ncbi:MAG: FAD-linked oxidase C-terminal domain-containing protein [Burkholderiales bacterium]